MPIETILFLAATLMLFGGFAGTLAYVDASTRVQRRANHPVPGE
ncbi:hypothetical protein [Ancylobacter defluvii]|uniref:Uncharacterized protein n=1 Tax=Ancylobacter defluvii TaxID=1282440 RepID=A0A9W6JVF3_9HYPH|nr:hypothetical protein [Ancylobacter defluvii]GLK84615.1 hypothetical protein GCM10017653_26850 [Ancylobacter defluvii]